MTADGPLSFRFLGEVSVLRGTRRIELPPSKKTRALLAYIVVTGRVHRRERLCNLLWDVTDDPRGALRWSLSKLRALVDDEDHPRVIATREQVEFSGGDIDIDVRALDRAVAAGLERSSIAELEALAARLRGEFLEGLDLADFHEFQSWCVAEREKARSQGARVLRALVARLAETPERALVHARQLVELDPLDEDARATLVELLLTAGRTREAEQEYRAGTRSFDELGPAHRTFALARVWNQPRGRAAEPVPEAATPTTFSAPPLPEVGGVPFVGRVAELARLHAAAERVRGEGRARAVLLNGEPGAGKSRLASEFLERARPDSGLVLAARAFEAELGRPFGPWMDALRALPKVALQPANLLPLLAPLLAPVSAEPVGGGDAEQARERLFGAVAELVVSAARRAPPVVLFLDDLQWFDEASAALLHYLLRMVRNQPVLVVLGAREGEIADNPAVLRVARSLRRELPIEELVVGPLARAEAEALVRAVAPGAAVERVFAQGAGNPLFTLELAQAQSPAMADEGAGWVPPTVRELVKERLERLDRDASEVLRWAAVLGRGFSAGRLEAISGVPVEQLVGVLERLERHALLQIAGADANAGATYAFAHDLIHAAVYGDISAPRRRLMHLRVAQQLAGQGGGEEQAAELARHASLGGDDDRAARACVQAAQRCLRLYANHEAQALVRRGRHYASALPEPDRSCLLIELLDVLLQAEAPADGEAVAAELRLLAEFALDHGALAHARLGFHLLAYLRWERADWAGARREMLRAEFVSRGGEEKERALGMAEAARCLALLERDLEQAEAMLLEVEVLARRTGVEPQALPHARGMLRAHQGQLDEAAQLFREAIAMARRSGDRQAEFVALESLTRLMLERGARVEAREAADELARIAEKLRDGSDAPFARCLQAILRHALGESPEAAGIEPALQALREADAKLRLSFALTQLAAIALERGDAALALGRAHEALALAERLERPGEVAIARVLAARAARALGDETGAERHESALPALAAQPIGFLARAAIDDLAATRAGARAALSGPPRKRSARPHGNRAG